MAREPLTGKELLERFGDPESAEKILDLRALSFVLRECIIADDYRPSKNLLKSMSSNEFLSEEGSEVRKKIGDPKGASKNQGASHVERPIYYSSIHALLELLHITPLVNIKKADTDAIALAISEEILDRKLLFPMIFGRELYDRFNNVVLEEKRQISHEVSLSILKDSPIGVFHVRRYLFGPLGLVKTDFIRNITPKNDPFIQHSADHSIEPAHRVWFQSSSNAYVNRFRSDYSKALESISNEKSNWSEYFQNITKSELVNFNEQSLGGLPYLIGDTLSDDELRTLVRELLEFNAEYASKVLKLIPEDWEGSLERNGLIQVILVADDQTIRRALDGLVFDKKIHIPKGEVRSSILNKSERFGYWATRMELGEWGTRTVSNFGGMPLLRLESLLLQIYEESSDTYRKDIDWKFRSIENISGKDKIHHLIREVAPRSLITQLILSSDEATRIAGENLEVDVKLFKTDSELSQILLWRLGFRESKDEGPSVKYRKQVTRALEVLSGDSVEGASGNLSVRAIAADLFPEMENYMREFIAFLVWLLFNDHYLDHPKFHYTPQKAQLIANNLLNSGNVPDVISNLTLGKVSGRLRQIVGLIKMGGKFEASAPRGRESFPHFSEKTNLQSFPFVNLSLAPVLSETSISLIIEYIEDFIRVFEENNIAELRNNLTHHNLNLPSRVELRDQLSKIDLAIRNLEGAGLFPVRRELTSLRWDAWGRGIATYSGENLGEVSRILPSKLRLAGVPTSPKYALIVPIARYREVDEVVAFSIGTDSEFTEYWQEFPVRPRQEGLLDIEDHSSGSRE